MVFGFSKKIFFGGGGEEVLNGTVWFITEYQRDTWQGGKKESNGLYTLFCDPVRAVQVVACSLMSVQRNTWEDE
jgi:hypothetical protein